MSNGNHYYRDNFNNSFKEARTFPEENSFLRNDYDGSSHDRRYKPRVTPVAPEEQQLLTLGPVKITPCWEDKDLPDDELNFKTLDREQVSYDHPPHDRFNLVYLILLIHGIGTLMPWNMFITAQKYYEDFKLNIDDESVLKCRSMFMNSLALASQIPNVLFNFLNVFIQIGGSLTTRIVISILAEVILFIITIVLAMVDTSSWAIIFFWITMATVVLLNMANGIYQNSVYGMAAKLPVKYTGAVILGSNISGTFTSVINIVSLKISPNVRTAAIYYFITALLVLLACFDTYFALPLMRFYRYHNRQVETKSSVQGAPLATKIPYWTIFKKSFMQLLNIFLIFFVTLSIFPVFQSKIRRHDPNFVVPEMYYTAVVCFLVFNFFAMVGSILPSLCRWPGPRWLCIPVFLRLFLIPAFMLCNYQNDEFVRGIPVYIYSDWAHFGLSLILGITGGYYSSLGMTYASRTVEPQHASVAGMMAATSLMLGIFCGLNFSIVLAALIQHIKV